MGWTFLWAFLDKAFALGFSTGRVLNEAGQTVKIDFFGPDAWINGASPDGRRHRLRAEGSLRRQHPEHHELPDDPGRSAGGWLDRLGVHGSLLLIGLGLISGVMTRLAAVGGIVWMATFYLGTAIWPEHNPFLDDHFVYAIVLVGLILANAGRYYGLGKVWQRVGFVQDRRYLY